MAQMNKKSDISSSRERLEKELMDKAQNGVNQAEIDTGRPHHATSWQDMLGTQMHAFAIKQGIRRRHPNRLLQERDGIMSTTSNAKDFATESLIYEQERIDLPDVYEYDGESTMLANQFYLPQVASQNAKNSREKLKSAVGLG